MDILTSHKFGEGNSLSGLITLRNENGLVAKFTPYGARWISMLVPDRYGVMDDVVLGFNSLNEYISAEEKYHGAIVGRVCGRIHNAFFRLEDETYQLSRNDVYGKPFPNHLHGGISAFHCRYWNGQFIVNEEGEESAVFSYTSEDGEEGYPGNLQVCVTYTLHHDNRLSMICKAITDKVTPINLTNHVFFNLCGTNTSNDILLHRLYLNSSRIIECDNELIPTGGFFSVNQTCLDFRKKRLIGESLRTSLFGIEANNGFSLAFALDGGEAAELYEDVSGRKLSIYTNQPSLQVYTGYFMTGKDIGKGNIPYFANAGIALETQGYPDAINHPEFPSILLSPGELYRNQTDYQFSIV